MTPRSHAWKRRAACFLVLCSAGLLALPGCDPRTLFYFLQPNEPLVAAPDNAPKLDGKRVAVVASASAGAQGDLPSLERDLARDFTRRLQKENSKINMVSQASIWDWVDGHPDWSKPAEIGTAFEADYVIFLEVKSFKSKEPGDLNTLHGTAETHVQVVSLDYPKNSRGKRLKDQDKEDEVVYDDYVTSEFPKERHIAVEGNGSVAKFKKDLLKRVAIDCVWQFVPHAPEDAIGDKISD